MKQVGAMTYDLRNLISDLSFLVNFTRFYVVANDPTSHIPLLTSSISSNRRRQALIRVTIKPLPASSQSKGASLTPNIFECLASLPPTLTPARVDRRPSLQAVPFQDVYFIELYERPEGSVEVDHDVRESEDGSERGVGRWAEDVQSGADRMNSLGAPARVLGTW